MHTLTRNTTANINENSTPTHSRTTGSTNLAYESDVQSTRSRTTTDYRENYPIPGTLERPPSYETSMRNQQNNVNSRYGADRQSTRSTRSVRSARSARSARSNRSTRSARTKRRRDDQPERREELPWVQIQPSASHMGSDTPYGHFP